MLSYRLYSPSPNLNMTLHAINANQTQDAIHGRENAGQMQSTRKEADTATNGHLAPSQKPGGTFHVLELTSSK